MSAQSHWFLLIFGLAACVADGPFAGDDHGPEPGEGVPMAPAPSQLDCAGLEAAIDLSAQIAANGEADRGRYPVVLAHGFMGFDRIGPLEYWNGAAAALRQAGFAAYVTAVEPVGSSSRQRGPELGRQIACIAAQSGADKVNIVGHSQGGLDARFVASASPYAPQVASVTTIATPHRGTAIADAALGLYPDIADDLADDLLDAIADLYGDLVGAPEEDADLRAGLEQLSEAHIHDFNQAHPDNPDVAYFSWGGRSVRTALSGDRGGDDCEGSVLANPDARDVIDPELLLTFEFLSWKSGRNDGLVALSSTKWGTFLGCIAADHADQVGMFQIFDTDPISGFNHRDFAIGVAEQLAARGL